VHVHEQVTGHAAVRRRVSLAADSQLHSILDLWRDAKSKPTRLHDPAGAAALRTHLPAAVGTSVDMQYARKLQM
jgi:hypothetical protein